jgi:hypothetical protein
VEQPKLPGWSDPQRLAGLPLGIQSLGLLREGGFVYVDKTDFAHRLVRSAGRYFLSRPRRFGKSLFVDTLKEIFEGNEALFEGLYIHDRWNWRCTYPVIKIDFADGLLHSRQAMDLRILDLLHTNAERLEVSCEAQDLAGRFGALIRNARAKHGQRAVVLVDEYDKPILDNIDQPEVAAAMREGLKNFYSVLKGQDAHLQFVFMTGVTKFSKVSLFSGMNQLNDITLDAAYSSICGYTENDLQQAFGAHLAGVDLAEVRRWYNGYNWTGLDTVYNPFDILLFIDKGGRFKNYWFETGNPSFLLKLFQSRRYFLPSLEQVDVREVILESFDVERIDPVTLLFQSGYLTIKNTFTDLGQLMFRLGVPNTEVKVALNDRFINAYTALDHSATDLQRAIRNQLLAADLQGLVATVKRLFAAIPWRNFSHNDLADAEGYYASVLYAFFSALDARVIPEDISNHGQVDLTVRLGAQLYLIEIKVLRRSRNAGKPGAGDHAASARDEGDGDARPSRTNPALAQLRARNYAAKYRGESGVAVHELGLVFCPRLRNLIQANWAKVT